jgi:hypothetical protein
VVVSIDFVMSFPAAPAIRMNIAAAVNVPAHVPVSGFEGRPLEARPWIFLRLDYTPPAVVVDSVSGRP